MMDKEEIAFLFSALAPKYDLLNHLLSLNIDRRWRRRLVEHARTQADDRILDVCTGTGDIAIEFARKVSGGKILGVDYSEEMLRIARQKIEKMGVPGRISLQKGDCLHLPFGNDTFDFVTIGFGLRNLTDYQRGITEMVRVLKRGGRLLILEFSLPQNPLLYAIYRLYLDKLIPFMGGIISGSTSAYKCLSTSIQNFPTQEEVIHLMQSSGLKNLFFEKLTGGIASIYGGEKQR